jgi:hypothetical protein
LAELTASIYQVFDDELIPVYCRLAEAQGRRLADGVEWADLAAAFSAVSEGLALRHLADEPSRARTLDWAVQARRALWAGMTVEDERARK